ncbi:hypothetical protein QWY93_19310 [Echinicola jeungdonensis]|uniref:hypothetical protein n=1 Tax=Echinicola jeungdonensis TaxID=709343 RepID=UPI0025B5D141|nr:hypothetical protein [Echinicola jeungdonensis]MDN3671405.1 hypothetical protein [Echinicola jeungdonensis]
MPLPFVWRLQHSESFRLCCAVWAFFGEAVNMSLEVQYFLLALWHKSVGTQREVCPKIRVCFTVDIFNRVHSLKLLKSSLSINDSRLSEGYGFHTELHRFVFLSRTIGRR